MRERCQHAIVIAWLQDRLVKPYDDVQKALAWL